MFYDPMKCPICRRPTTYSKENSFRPFCSERCKLIDFGAWANEEYSVPSEESPHLPDETDQGRAQEGDDSARLH
ncbi:MAG TPA: DNA gyrase inhibitor YacG [Pyrinomonadaceae bacterium]|nr:DNA gyrase inhibitor YacG [Pyrinomonadaceae bacterium]